jgi:hypothetical protein
VSDANIDAVNVPDRGVVGVPEIFVDTPKVVENVRPGGRVPEKDKVLCGVSAFVNVTPSNGVSTVRT